MLYRWTDELVEQQKATEHEKRVLNDWLDGQPIESLDRTPITIRKWSNEAIVQACSLLQLHQRKDVQNVLGVIDYAIQRSRETGIPFDDIFDAILDVSIQEKKWNTQIAIQQKKRNLSHMMIGKHVTAFYRQIKSAVRELKDTVYQSYVVCAAVITSYLLIIYEGTRVRLTAFYDSWLVATDAPNTLQTKKESEETMTLTDDTVTPMSDNWPMYHYRATVLRVIDGDTLIVTIDCGFRVNVAVEIRLLGINAPEMHTPTRTEGEAARDYLTSLVTGKQLYLRTEKDKRSFTRYIGSVWVNDESEHMVSVNDAMVASGHATIYATLRMAPPDTTSHPVNDPTAHPATIQPSAVLHPVKKHY